MPTPAVEVQAGSRTVRVTSPERVIYEETPTTPAVTKLQVVEYYVAVEDGIMRALRDRPTALERWPKGVRDDIRLATRNGEKADAFYSKRVPKGAPDYVDTVGVRFPSGRAADEVCPTEIATVAWAAQMGTITFHPWPVRRGDADHPDELRIDLDPQPGTDFADAAAVAMVARQLLEEVGLTGFPKTSGNRGVHIYVRVEPRWDFVEVRHAAIAFARELERRSERVTTSWWKEERGARVFVDYNQNARDRTIASAYSLRPVKGAPVSTPVAWEELEGLDPRSLTLHTVPQRLADRGDPMARMGEAVGRLDTLLQMYADDIASGLTDMPYPPDYPKMPGEPPRVQPSRINPVNWAGGVSQGPRHGDARGSEASGGT